MESILKTNDSQENVRIITLKDYYQSLPESTSPKTEFVNDIAFRCNVTSNTVRNWISYGMKPSNPEHVKIISEVTGIPCDQLWGNRD